MSKSGTIKTQPDSEKYFKICPDGEVFVHPVDGRRVSIPHGENATVSVET